MQLSEGEIDVARKNHVQETNTQVRWPDLRTPLENLSSAEVRGVLINPIVTGIGSHRRLISDEDWVLSCERDIDEHGLEQFLTDLLHILRLTIPNYLGPSQPIGDYPPRRLQGDVPLPDVSYPGDPNWQQEWNEIMIGGLLCNPVYTGIGPFPQMVDDQRWIAAGVQLVKEKGLRQYLVNVLYQLKKSFEAVR